VNINAFRPELLNDALNGVVADLDYAKTTLAFMLSVLVLFASLPAGYALLAWRRRRPLLADRTVYLSVLLAFLLYPTLNQRLLKLYLYLPVGEHRLLDADKRLEYEEIGWARATGVVFLLLYTAGIPIGFMAALRVSARGFLHSGSDGRSHLTEAAVEVDSRNQRRFGLLFTKYKPHTWWWEVYESLRKLFITGIIVFVAPGTALQMWVAIFTSLGALLATT
jgi:hypothetical protein